MNTAASQRGEKIHDSHSPAKYLPAYTAAFAVCAAVIFLPFILKHKSFVYRIDGESQYIVYLTYMGRYLRQAFSNLLHGDFTPVMYDFTIGLGDDINAIVRFHPLDFLSFFVPEKYTEILYAVIILLRYYLSGLSFSLLAFFLGRRQDRRPAAPAVLSGALIYVFGGYMLMRVLNHPTYAAPFIVLPLLLVGMEHVIEKRNICCSRSCVPSASSATITSCISVRSPWGSISS